MKRVFGKNQVIITALAIMIAVAGYLSITQDNAEDAAELAADTSEDLIGVDGYVVSDNGDIITENPTTGTDQSGEGTGEAAGTGEGAVTQGIPETGNAEGTIVDSADTAGTDTAGTDTAGTDTSGTDMAGTESAAADASGTAEVSADNVGEAVLVSSVIGAEYFDSAKLAREQTRSRNKEILMEIVNSTATTETQREKAVTQIIGLTSDSEKETAAESMLEAKGFGKCIVSIVDGSVDVIVNANNLTEAEIAQVEDIVKRKTDAKASDIVITPVGVNTAK